MRFTILKGRRPAQFAFGRTLAPQTKGMRLDQLSGAFSPAEIRVPLAKQERARFYREQGLSHPKIARLPGVTERSVMRLLERPVQAENGFNLAESTIGIIAGLTAVSVIGLIGMVISGLFGNSGSSK